MSRISKLKLELAKLLASFKEIKTDKAVLTYPSDEEIEVGFEVYVINENGEYVTPEDGEYRTEDDKIITLVNGKVESINEVETTEEPVEEPVEVVAEETVPEETEVTETPSEDLRKEIDELYAIIESLTKEIATIKESVEKMGKMSAAMSAQEEIEKVNTIKNTGDSVLDRKLKNFLG